MCQTTREIRSPFDITAPEGCFLNPRYPAAVEARATVGHYSTSAIFNTLALALPDKVPAESGIPLHGFAVRGQRNGRVAAGIFFFNGGLGARADADGISTLSFPTNVSNTPVEVLSGHFHYGFTKNHSFRDLEVLAGIKADLASGWLWKH